MELKQYLQRLLLRQDVAREVRFVMTAQARVIPLALVSHGHGELIWVGYAIHCCVSVPDAPFIVCDPRRRGPISARSPYRCVRSGLEALREAERGSVYFHSYRLPHDWEEAFDAWRGFSSTTMLIVDVGVPQFLLECLRIPRLTEVDVKRLVDEVADPEDREFIIRARPASLHEIEKLARRLRALRHNQTLSEAAKELRMRGVSLKRYLQRHGLQQLPKGAARTSTSLQDGGE